MVSSGPVEKRISEHNLKPDTKAFSFPHAIYLDVETSNVQVSPTEQHLYFRLAVVEDVQYDKDLNPISEERHVVFTPEDLAQLVSGFANKRGVTYLIAHNATFDIGTSHLLDRLSALGWEIKPVRIEKGSYLVKATRNHRHIYIIDSLNFLRGSIDDLGKLIGLEKLTINTQTADNESLITYCKRDVTILRLSVEAYLRFLKEHDLGSFGVTAASQALRAFKHRFMTIPPHVHTNEKVKERERHALHGGVVMAFRPGVHTDGPFVKTDINSLYPSVMLDNEFPYRFSHTVPNPTLDKLKRLVNRYALIAEVTIHPKKPYFPRRVKRGTLFPLYPFRTVLTTPEIIEALEQDAILEVHAIDVYRKGKLFVNFVNYLYNLRLQFKAQNNRIYDLFTKLLMNGLYGKFGARNVNWIKRDDLTAISKIKPVDKEIGVPRAHAVYYINKEAYTPVDIGDANDSAVYIAAHVTAYGRLKILKLIEIAGIENVYYCDTDSIITNLTGYENLKAFIDDTKLGMLKVEGWADTLIIWGKKDYMFGAQIVHKGIPRNARQIDENTFEIEIWSTMRGLLNSPDEKPYRIIISMRHLKRDNWYATLKDGRLIPHTKPGPDDPNPLQLTPLSPKQSLTPPSP